VALNQGEDALKAVLNDAVAEMLSSGALNASSEEWLNTPLDPANLEAE
jgi:polar amino acid transport system substrate-binding protein